MPMPHRKVLENKIFEKGQFIISSFMDQTPMSYLRSVCLNQGHRFASIFSSGSFIALAFTLTSMIHLELSVKCGVSEGFWYEYPVVPAPFGEGVFSLSLELPWKLQNIYRPHV